MRKSWLVILSCILVVGLILTGCGGNPITSTVTSTQTATTQTTTTAVSTVTTTSVQPIINIRIGGGMPQGHAISVSILGWKDKVEKATDGRVKVTFYEAGTMGKSAELYDLVLNGTLEAGHMAEFWTGGRFPLIEGIDSLPFTFKDMSQNTEVVQRLFKAGLLKELEPFKYLYFTGTGTINIFDKNKIATMADFKGAKLRATGLNVEICEALGGTAVTIPGEEEYMAFDKGILTGNFTGVDNVKGRKLWEVLNYGCQTPVSMGGFVFIMNKDFWNSLPADIQAIIDGINEEQRTGHVTAQMAAQAADWDTVAKNGIEVYTLADDELAKWKQATSSIANDWVNAVIAKGLPGNEVMDTIKAVTGK